MKILFSLTAAICLSLVMPAYAQTIQTTPTISKTAPTTILSSGKTTTIGPKLPDLKFSELRVTAAQVLDNGTVKYNLNISYTVTNGGTASASTDDIVVQAFYTNEADYPRIQDLSFTNHFQPAGGQTLCTKCASGETLAPGASITRTLTRYNVPLSKTPKPVYLVVINPFGGATESDATNNRAYMTILL
jgi:hypothetical protein